MSQATRELFYNKYKDVIISMFDATGDDKYVCIDKLVYMTEHRNDTNADFYPGIPEDFDYAVCQEDINQILRAD